MDFEIPGIKPDDIKKVALPERGSLYDYVLLKSEITNKFGNK